MDLHDIKSAVHGRTRAVLPHTEGGEPKARHCADHANTFALQ